MLTGEKLGAAIEQAREKKGVSKKALADAMGVKPASVQDWVRYGRIAKERINDLVAYFADVVGPEHWGARFPLSQAQPTGHIGRKRSRPELFSGRLQCDALAGSPNSSRRLTSKTRICGGACERRAPGEDLD
ncbi:helix-turn-helix domain-containing protein [Cupriavidus sp. H18C1]|uniref:helix-turn-helix domain-containing protein n=1 Tax=Cupriavidus sp. H18C1 TaxID=3241601 RepID=UPI003BB8E9FB